MGETQPGALNLAMNCQPTGGFKSHEARGDHKEMRQTQKKIGPMSIPWAFCCSEIREERKVNGSEEKQSLMSQTVQESTVLKAK